MTGLTMILLIAIPVVILFAQTIVVWFAKKLESKIDSVHAAVNSNLHATQLELKEALNRVAKLEVEVEQLHKNA